MTHLYIHMTHLYIHMTHLYIYMTHLYIHMTHLYIHVTHLYIHMTHIFMSKNRDTIVKTFRSEDSMDAMLISAGNILSHNIGISKSCYLQQKFFCNVNKRQKSWMIDEWTENMQYFVCIMLFYITYITLHNLKNDASICNYK